MHVGRGMPNKVSYRPPDMIDHRTLDDTSNSTIILKFDRHLGSNAADVHVKFKSDATI